MWKPTATEISKLLSTDPAGRYRFFINHVADEQVLWSIWDSKWVLYRTESGMELVPVWPHALYVASCCEGEFKNVEPRRIELADWLERWIPGMIKDRRSVAVFPTPGNHGILVSPERCAMDLEHELLRY